MSVIDGDLQLHSVLLKTSYNGKSRPLIGPFKCDVTCLASWLRHSGSPLWPQIVLTSRVGALPVYVGQGHVKCLQLMTTQMQQFIEVRKCLLQNQMYRSVFHTRDVNCPNLDLIVLDLSCCFLQKLSSVMGSSSRDAVAASASQRQATSAVKDSTINIGDTSYDDLRSGLLQYVTIESESAHMRACVVTTVRNSGCHH